MNICLFGLQGSGKSTQASILSSRFDLKHIQIGELVRLSALSDNQNSDLIDDLANKKGKLLPDEIIFELLQKHLHEQPWENLLFDGLPRTLEQHQQLHQLISQKGQQIDLFIFVKVPEELAIRRVQTRNVCNIYEHLYDPQSQASQIICEINPNVRERTDLSPQALSTHIEEFDLFTQPLLAQLRTENRLIEINGDQPIDKVYQDIEHIILQKFPHLIPKNHQKFAKLFVVTHSESEYNKKKIFTGQLDVALTPEGHHKAELVAEILRQEDIKLAYRTRLVRTEQTLSHIIKHHPDMQVVIDDRLLERDYGELVGLNKDDYKRDHPDTYPLYHRSYDVTPPGGESMQTVEQRVLPALEEIIHRIKSERINVLVVAHSNSIRPIRRYFEKLSTEEMMQLDNQRHIIFTYEIPLEEQPATS